MALRKFTEVEVIYQYAPGFVAQGYSAFFGVVKDNYIDAGNPTINYGNGAQLRLNKTDPEHFVVEIQMPSEEDIIGFDELNEVWVGFQHLGSAAGDSAILCIEITDIWTEGAGGTNASNWNEAQSGVPWKAGVGAVKSRFGAFDTGEKAIDTVGGAPP